MTTSHTAYPRFRLQHARRFAVLLLAGTALAGLPPATPAQAQTWTGATSTDWFATGNWSPNTVPTAGSTVIIDTVTPNPTLIGGSAVSNIVTVGQSATGALTVSGGGALTAAAVTAGDLAGSTGTVTVTGVGSTLTTTGIGNQVVIGNYGSGALQILNGGVVSDAGGIVGQNTGGVGTATVDGLGSIWTNTSTLTVGSQGTGTLTLTNQGQATASGIFIGVAGGTGTVTLTGQSAIATTGALNVGFTGTGTLTIASNSFFISDGGTIGNFAGAGGAVTVTGAGSAWSFGTSDLTIGASGTGSLLVSNSGRISSGGGNGFLGQAAGANGTLTIDGAGSSWVTGSSLFVGVGGTGTMMVSNGGLVITNDGTLGGAAGGTGVVTVTGPNSNWTTSGGINVGNAGSGSLTISNGGAVNSVGGTVGALANSSGTAMVTGAGSNWSIGSGDLIIGQAGTGSILVANGGAISGSNGSSYLGQAAGSSGTVTVTGAGSSWTIPSSLLIGINGTGAMTISNGGAVNTGDGYLGVAAGGTGALTVTGANSTWTSTGGISVGSSGSGVLTISNGGTVSTAVGMAIAASAGSTGALNIGADAASAAAAPGALTAPAVLFGSGTGSINFNHTSASYDFAPVISGAGTINQIAGTTILSANSSAFTGATNVFGGRLAVNGSLAGSVVTVSGGILGGNGTVGGIVVNTGGIVGPGNSIGTLTVNGNVTQAAGSIYQVELTSTGQSDLIHATGTATIGNGALLSAVKTDAAPYVVGTHYTVLQADGGVTGTYTITGGSTFIGLAVNTDPTHVYLDVTKVKSFAAAGLTSNQIAAGGAAESLGGGNPLYGAILQLPTDAAARAAFDQISGEVHASSRTVMIEDSRFVREAATDRLRAAFDATGMATMPVTAYVDGTPTFAAATTDRFAVWGRGFGSWGSMQGDGNAATVRRDIGGFLTGGDGRIGDSARIGALGGYSRSTFRVGDRNSSGASDNYHLGLYGGTEWGNLALRSGLAYTWHQVATSRTVAFAGFADMLKADYGAATSQAFGELGYGLRAGRIAFEPFANLAYVNLSSKGFTENGGAAALTARSGDTGVTFTTLGLRASSGFVVGNGVQLTARGMLGWRHAYGDTTPYATMSLVGSSAFNVAGVPIAVNAAAVEAGLDFNITPNTKLGLSYGGQFGSGLTDQTMQGNLSVKF
jgi:outer membrane autotransporter protein